MRPTRPSVSPLEARALLNGDLAGTWIGQDAHDYVGPSTVPGPDGVQDIHIGLSGIPQGKTIASVDVQGLGGGEWVSPASPGGPWAADVIQASGATTADVFVEPYQVETGRPFSVSVDYTDGTTDSAWFQGGAANPNLRMPSDAVTITAATQNGQDLTGLGPDVGPDGYQDVDLSIAGLSPTVSIVGAEVDGSAGTSWAFGHNPLGLNNAELIRDSSDPTKADIFFQPNADLDGQTLTLTIDYGDNTTDTTTYVVSTHINPTLPMPASPALPTVVSGVSAQWIGQDGLNLTGQGDVHVHIAGIPAGRTVVAATLSDEAGTDWGFANSGVSYDIEPFEPTLGYKVSSTDPTQADLSFSPDRSEAGSSMTLRLQLDNGTIAIATFSGGTADPGLKVSGPSTTSIVAQPGDNLNTLANSYGTVHLSAGEYDLSQPLVLNQPVTITADPGVTLMFSQPSGATPWTAAILINASHTTLNGFAVRFATTINWNPNIQYGPAVIGSSDNINSGFGDPKEDETLTNLDLQAPPPVTTWEQTPDLIRFVTAANGVISGNTLKGGTTEVAGGPWTITNNNYTGTVADTYTPTAFAAHQAHDLVLEGNTAEPAGTSGKTYRFLTMNVSGFDDTIADNDIVGIGPMDDDTEPDGNSPEIILTEAYSLQFEGSPTAISSDGRILQIPNPQGGAAKTGDIVSILTGPDAGQYRMIAQAINATTYLMDSPLPSGDYAISIAIGFVGETYKGNTVNATGSSVAVDLDLQGDQFGATVENNTFLGGNAAFLLDAAPTENPDGFGWSHAPFLGATITGNTISDAIQGGGIAVTGGETIDESAGRVYFSGTLTNNLFTFSDSFLAAHPIATALTVGDEFSIDPGEIALTASGNQVYASASANLGNPVEFTSATINGTAETDDATTFPRKLPATPTGLQLVSDTGESSTDGITNLDALQFNAVSGASGYEYAVGSATGTYLPVSNPADFVPAGISQGSNTVYVRAFDSGGNRGQAASVTFTYDTVPPLSSPPALAPGDDSGRSATDGITDDSDPAFTVTGDPTDLVTLLRNGAAVASRTGPGTISEPSTVADGTYSYSLLRTDLAGNTSTSPTITVTIDTTPPVSSPPTLAPGSDSGRSQTDGITNDSTPSFVATGDPTDVISLLRNGVPVASITGPGTLTEPSPVADGTYAYSLERTDVAGNTSTSATISVTIDTTPPISSPPALAPGSDTGASATDGITNVLLPTFTVSGDPTDLIELLRNGVSVSSEVGPGTLLDPTVLSDGTYQYSVRRTDLAGNVSVSPTIAVTLDRTPPPAVSGLVVSSTHVVSFQPTSPTDTYVYRVGTTGPYTSIGQATSFTPTGLAQGLNTVQVHAIDLAGNVGLDSTIVVNTSTTTPSGVWLGQDGHDYVSESWNPVPDGIQDIHIALAGLRAGHAITSVDVRGLGGGEWVSPSTPGGPFAAVLIETAGATTADLYLAAYQVETGRPFSVQFTYDDGVQAGIWVTGGAASPTLAMPHFATPLGSPVAAVPISVVSPIVAGGVVSTTPSTPVPVVSPAPVSPPTIVPQAPAGTSTTTDILNSGSVAASTLDGPTTTTGVSALKRPLLLARSHAPVLGLGWRRAALAAHRKSRKG